MSTKQTKLFKDIKEFRKKFPRQYLEIASRAEVISHIYPLLETSRVMRGFWTKERCAEEARKYKSISEWRNNSPSSYSAAKEKKWVDDICSECAYKKKLQKHTLNSILAEASKYSSLGEWSKSSPGSYSSAVDQGLTRKIANKLGWKSRHKNGHWNTQTVMKELKQKKIKSIKQWRERSAGSLNWAKKQEKELYEDICLKAGIKKRIRVYGRSNHEIELDAKKYKSLLEWGEKSGAIYKDACNRKIQRQIAKKLGWLKPTR